MERRQFIKTACTGCFAVAGFSLLTPLLQGCSPSSLIYKATGEADILSIPVSALAGKNYLVVRSKQLDDDLLLVKDSDTKYHSLLMQCTHQDQPLVLSGSQLVCNTHGSRFSLNGQVLADPATEPLHQFKTELNNTNILIHLRNN